jgi:hypothetical protein
VSWAFRAGVAPGAAELETRRSLYATLREASAVTTVLVPSERSRRREGLARVDLHQRAGP